MKDYITDIFQWKSFILKNVFNRTSPGDCFWYFENLTFKRLILNIWILTLILTLINIVGTLFDA